MREGSLEAPVRHPIDWNDPDFYDEAKLDDELRRVFDICHGCRRCFNLCDSFPRLFDLIDAAPSEELDTVESKDFKPVVDACTLCDMCFMVKCPYVPPHEFNLDFPHLMLRYRAVEARKGEVGFIDKQLTETDRNGKLGTGLSGLANWATKRDNGLTRPVMKATAGIHPDADLPKFADKPLTKAVEAREANGGAPVVNKDAPAYGRKAVIYATCFSNWNRPEIGMAALEVLARNGVETKVLHPECCGMPQLEHGDLGRVAGKARSVAATLGPYVEDGWDIVAMVPSCALMLKFEWPLIVPDDPSVERLAKASFDVSEYIVGIAKKEGMAEGLEPLDGDISVHISCHSRAQNMGQKATELLRLIPKTKVKPIERCSGHGGSWGVK
ncbi:MAG: (Fe-S)-binding protein [Rhodospirillaceae bacterium]